jgi:signal transduction histidine kinase
LPQVPTPPQSLASLEDYESQITSRHLKVGCLLVMVLMPAGVVLDYFVYPEHLVLFWTLRCACAILEAGLFLLLRRPIPNRYYPAIGLVIALLPIAFICWMIHATDGGTSPYYAGLNLVLLAIAFVLRWTVGLSLAALLGAFAMYLAACFLGRDLEGATDHGLFVNNLYFLTLTGIIILVGSRMHYELRLRELGLTLELDQNRQRLEQSNQKLLELDQAKSHFFANISHELRTPLTLLLAPLESILQRPDIARDAALRDLLLTMQANGMRLLRLINDLLDLVRLESNRLEVRPEPVEIEAFLGGLVNAARTMADSKQIQLTSRIAPGLGHALLDRDKLEKILLNLLFNALKFTPENGHVELIAHREQDQLVLAVQDNGIGIPEHQLPSVFSRFWQADSSARRRHQGAGIGLALVKELTEIQQGSVAVQSQEGQGSRFTVRLPHQSVPEPLPTATPVPSPTPPAPREEWLEHLYRRATLFPATASQRDRTLSHVSPSRDSSRHRILVADDEPDMRRFLRSQLERGYDVDEAPDGAQAVEKATTCPPDLVLLDMMMPEMDGLEACRRLRQHEATRNVPVVLLTARADEETKIASLSAGANDFLTKPFSTTELAVRVHNLVQNHLLQRRLAEQNRLLEATIEQLKETEVQLVQAEKLASLGRLSAGIIHEINNPLNYATTNLFALRRETEHLPQPEQSNLHELVRDIEEGIGRVRDIVINLRAFTHPGTGEPEEVGIDETVQAALRFLSHELRQGIQVRVDLEPSLVAYANRNRLLQVFLNLLQNCLDALGHRIQRNDEPAIWITGERHAGRTRITIGDNGPGIPSDMLDKVFDPFFTTKEIGQGIGLGLSISYRILQQSGGQITARSEPGRFTEMILDLPTTRPPIPDPHRGGASDPGRGGESTGLVRE